MDHTWAEGIQACKGLTDSVSVIAPLRVMPCDPLSDSEKQTSTHRAVGMSDAGIQDCADCFALAEIIVSTFIITIWHVQMHCHFF